MLFDGDSIYLTDRFRIEKLFAIVSMAYAWAYAVGDFIHRNIKPVRILNNGRKAHSIIKYGLNYINRFLFAHYIKNSFDPLKFLSYT
ncbi:MAG: hypothetical protein LBH12_02095 [Dysgonamonadaceae bacterium]|jgi:hypothetical protein|nr:hypothetical protein [Dysgonamonadaceae bacterium]